MISLNEQAIVVDLICAKYLGIIMGKGAIDLDKLYEREGNIHHYKVSSPHFENA